jgi:xylulokinase
VTRPSLAIGVDVGSTNVKVVVASADGSLLAHRQRSLATDGRPPVCEQDPEQIWEAVLDGVAACVAEVARAPAGPAPTVAIGVASQYSSTVPVRADGSPAGPVLMWRDRRGTDACHRLFRTPGMFELWVERHGIPPIGGGLSLGHVLHLIAEDPHGDTRFVEVMDYVTARLTGRVTATRHTMFTTQLCDNRSVAAWSAGDASQPDTAALGYDPDLLGASGVDPARLPELVAPDRPVGEVTPEVAARLGVAARSTVATGINDTAAAALATGAAAQGDGGHLDVDHGDATRLGVDSDDAVDLDDGEPQAGVIAGLAIGTTAVLVTSAPGKAEDLDHEILTMPAPDGGHLLMAENGLGGRVPEAFLAMLDGTGAGAAGQFAEAEVALASTEPGAGGVLCLPWLAGSMAPASSDTARGGFVGMSLATTRSQLIRATFEGVGHNLAWLLRHVEAFIGETIVELRLTGGGAEVAGWPQVIADVVNRPVRVVADPSVAVARAAALRALAQVSDRSSAPAESASPEPVLSSNPETRSVYDGHQRAFEATFEALGPVWNLLSSS